MVAHNMVTTQFELDPSNGSFRRAQRLFHKKIRDWRGGQEKS
jgi:hypothetical protein